MRVPWFLPLLACPGVSCGGEIVTTVNSRTVQIADCDEVGGTICWTRMVVVVPDVEVTQATGRNTALLTDAGMDASTAAAATLDSDSAEDTCGGACAVEVTLSWEVNGRELEAAYEEGTTPAELAEAEAFTLELSEALVSCDETHAWVKLGEGCSALDAD